MVKENKKELISKNKFEAEIHKVRTSYPIFQIIIWIVISLLIVYIIILKSKQ